jgi:hypothetical protein
MPSTATPGYACPARRRVRVRAQRGGRASLTHLSVPRHSSSLWLLRSLRNSSSKQPTKAAAYYYAATSPTSLRTLHQLRSRRHNSAHGRRGTARREGRGPSPATQVGTSTLPSPPTEHGVVAARRKGLAGAGRAGRLRALPWRARQDGKNAAAVCWERERRACAAAAA